MTITRPAEAYLPCDDLWIVTTYYNPAGYRTKRENYARFAEPILRAGINLVTVECAFGTEPFELEPSPRVIQIRSRDVMWLKERLINIAIARLPLYVTKVAWIDADILFTNPAWAQETSALLDRWPLIQPFASMARLAQGQNTFTKRARRAFACEFQRRPELTHFNWVAHSSSPGGAWATQRSLIERHGLYDAAIVGGGDELFAHAAVGGLNSRCVKGITGARHKHVPRLVFRATNRLLRFPWPRWLAGWYLARVQIPPVPAPTEHFFAHYLRWAQPFAADVQARVGYVPGTALHLWHGEPVNRQYSARNAILTRHNFTPTGDVRLDEFGVWEWASDKPTLHREVRDYFRARREDGGA